MFASHLIFGVIAFASPEDEVRRGDTQLPCPNGTVEDSGRFDGHRSEESYRNVRGDDCELTCPVCAMPDGCGCTNAELIWICVPAPCGAERPDARGDHNAPADAR